MDGKHKFINKIKEYVISVILVTISANIALFPIILYYFQNISLITILSNLLVSPLFGIILICSFLLVIFSLILNIPTFIGNIFQKLVGYFLAIPHFCASIPLGNIKMIVFPWYINFLYYGICVFIVFGNTYKRAYPRINIWIFKKVRLLLGGICIGIIIMQMIHVIWRDFSVTMIDVGQGDSTLIQTRKGVTMLIDGGGEKEGSSFKVGERITLPYLLHRGILSLDYIMISHFDSDHSAGVLPILENCKVRNIIVGKQGETSNLYQEIYQLAKKKNIRIIEVKKGDVIKLDEETSIEILHPDKELIGENILNNNSIVCKIQYHSFSMLFTGDIEKIAEKELVQKYKEKLKATVLKVAHHGSKSSSIQEFIEEVNPKVALIGVGKDNSFGHPSLEVLERLEKRGIQIFRTDNQGEITIKVGKKGKIIVKTFINE